MWDCQTLNNVIHDNKLTCDTLKHPILWLMTHTNHEKLSKYEVLFHYIKCIWDITNYSIIWFLTCEYNVNTWHESMRKSRARQGVQLLEVSSCDAQCRQDNKGSVSGVKDWRVASSMRFDEMEFWASGVNSRQFMLCRTDGITHRLSRSSNICK